MVTVGAASADWTVERGDTLYSIAQRHDTTVDRLVAANDFIEDPNLIYVGQEIAIPGDGEKASRDSANTDDGDDGADEDTASDSSGSSASPESDGEVRTTTVRADDTVESVAERLGVTRDQFLVANGYTHLLRLPVGGRMRSHAGPPPGGGTANAVHVVALGDTVAEIAAANGVAWTDIVEANDLVASGMIYVGDELTIPGRGGGGFTCPVRGDVSFTNDFAMAKGDDRYHEGIDLFAARGTDVVAPVGGTVEHVNGTRGGKQAHLFGDDGYRYWATHLDSLGPTGRVSAGEVIGTVGTTGNAATTAPHVHFEVYLSGQSVNPHPALAEAC